MAFILDIKTIFVRRKPTRRELLMGLSELQRLIGSAHGNHANDRDPNGFQNAQKQLEVAHNLAIDLQGYDSPTTKIKDIE